MSTLRVGSLFAGIGGFELGLHATGAYRTVWHAEWEEFPASILAKRFPGAQAHADVRALTGAPAVDVLAGGFPCQDLSLAGKGAGIRGRRSGMWAEYARLIGELQPALILAENVPALLHRGMEVVVRDLVELGYNVEWDCLPAAYFGAWHLRDRVWIAAHRHPEPVVFGQPAALFALEPSGAAEIVGGDDDPDDQAEPGWLRWPRAGWVTDTPELVLPLEPLAPRGAFKPGRYWPTATAMDSCGSRNATARRPNGNGRHHGGVTLTDAMILTGNMEPPPTALPPEERPTYPTPRASDADRGGRGDLLAVVNGRPNAHSGRTLWPTATARDHKDTGTAAVENLPHRDRAAGNDSLAARVERVRQGLYPTPKAAASGPDYARAARDGSGGDDLATAIARSEPAPLNPAWVEWLMGFPVGWTDPADDQPTPLSWAADPGATGEIPRTARDVPHRARRLTAVGNALVPPAAAWLGERALPAIPAREERAA